MLRYRPQPQRLQCYYLSLDDTHFEEIKGEEMSVRGNYLLHKKIKMRSYFAQEFDPKI